MTTKPTRSNPRIEIELVEETEATEDMIRLADGALERLVSAFVKELLNDRMDVEYADAGSQESRS